VTDDVVAVTQAKRGKPNRSGWATVCCASGCGRRLDTYATRRDRDPYATGSCGRVDTRYCSSACRQRAYRERVTAATQSARPS
jgi:hypothetical protein